MIECGLQHVQCLTLYTQTETKEKGELRGLDRLKGSKNFV